MLEAMKNASIQVNVEKQIPNVGLRLFFCARLSVSLPSSIRLTMTIRSRHTPTTLLDCGLEFTPSPFRVSTRWPALRIGPRKWLIPFLEWRCTVTHSFPLLPTPWWSVTGGYVYLSLRVSQGVESTREKELTSWLRVRSLISMWGKDWNFVLSFYTQNLLGFDSYLEIGY